MLLVDLFLFHFYYYLSLNNFHRHVRLSAFFDNTMFRSILYHPDESQILTCGSDRKITYWDATDGEAIRVIEGSEAEINSIDIDESGSLFVSGGNDKLVRSVRARSARIPIISFFHVSIT